MNKVDILWKKQTYHTCGQTCVAMVAGVSLDDALIHFKKRRGTGPRDLHNALTALGCSCPDKLIRVTKIGLSNLCIVRITWFDKKGKRLSMGHWAVYYDGKFYDPESGVYEDADYRAMIGMWNGKITSYLPIEENK